ncbi:hypothetical protein CEXT_403971 [Caerostris extrusa]|uniref:Uncharacterized protein n=1 Tax=Caerostris extrusa TaxID=172846 RepID=A0AAV4RKV1_CAEEX|nr:hypothetical protein CEXT_403971 [Caerostris extrusa]
MTFRKGVRGGDSSKPFLLTNPLPNRFATSEQTIFPSRGVWRPREENALESYRLLFLHYESGTRRVDANERGRRGRERGDLPRDRFFSRKRSSLI